MTRHRIDLFALLFGIAFAFASLVLFATQFTDTTPGPRWMIASSIAERAGSLLRSSMTKSLPSCTDRA